MEGDPGAMQQEACRMKLEGIICKPADAPYSAGRGHGWVKVKCQNREEFVVLGWTPPRGSRAGFGALHLGYYDREGRLHYAGGVGTGFSDDQLAALRGRLDALAADPPAGLLVAGEPLEKSIRWVRPALVAEVQFAAWSGAGRVRHAVYLGLREDKAATEVVRDVADPAAGRAATNPPEGKGDAGARTRLVIAVPPRRPSAAAAARPGSRPGGTIVTAPAPAQRRTTIGRISLSHPERALWPGITKQDLAEYWQAVADHALPGLARRPLAVVRCPDGIGGEHFFQKHSRGTMPDAIHEGSADKAPYLAIEDADGLFAMAQISAIELHAWGATEADPLHPDRLVFDLDPGEGVPFEAVARAVRGQGSRRGQGQLGPSAVGAQQRIDRSGIGVRRRQQQQGRHNKSTATHCLPFIVARSEEE